MSKPMFDLVSLHIWAHTGQLSCMGPVGVQMLDLSNTWVDDADISKLVEECPELRSLKLAGCRKLAAVSETLLTPDTGMTGRFTRTSS